MHTTLGKLAVCAHSFQGDEGKREDNKTLSFQLAETATF